MKKFIGLVIAFALAVQVIPMNVFAANGDGVSITASKKLRAGMLLKANVTPTDGDFSLQWLESDSEEGEYKPIYKAQSDSYMLTTLDQNKYIKLKATNNKDLQEVISIETKKLDSLGPLSRTNYIDEISDAQATPKENIFYIGDKGFILLDEFDDDSSRYYVMSEDFYGEKAFDSVGYAKFDITKKENIGYFLNNEFLTDGNGGKVLPPKILEHINYNHTWWTEAGAANGDCPTDYSFSGGVGLMSVSELMKYYGTFGWQPLQENGNWWLRTQRGISPSVEDNMFAMMGVAEGGRGNAWDKSCTDSNFIRPVFFLDSTFFDDTKLNPSNIGEKIVNILKEKYSLDDLKKMYTTAELEEMGILKKEFKLSFKPEKVVELNNDIKLKAQTDVFTQEPILELRYQWLYKNIGEDNFKPIYKATTDEYFVSTEDIGKTISLEVTPIMQDGTFKDTITTSLIYEVKSIGGVDRTALSAEHRQEMKTTPTENSFTVNGMKYILLNEYQDKNSQFYVMAEDLYGNKPFDADKTQKFDVEDKNNIGYFLNHEFLTEGNEDKKLPASIVSYIDFSHIWWTEAGHANGNCPTDYSFTAGISLISKTEYGKYREKIGWNTASEWWTRTARTRNGGANNIFAMTLGANGGDLWDRGTEFANIAIRPVFFLNHNFFADVKVSNMGANVIKAITDNYSLSELLSGKAGYTVAELDKLGILKVPQVMQVTIGGNAAVNAVLKGSYKYFHQDNKLEKDSNFGFEISDDNITFTQCADNVLIYQVKAGDNEKYIRFYCQPKDVDNVFGEKQVSRAIRITSKQGIAVTKMSIKEIDNGIDFSKMSTITPKMEITNYSEKPQSAVCIIAIYDKNSNLKKMNTKEVSVAGGKTVCVDDFSLEQISHNKFDYARIFVVDSFLDMNSIIGYEVVLR